MLDSQNGGKVSSTYLQKSLSWTEDRTVNVLEHLVQEGMAWVDDQSPDRHRWFWFPSLVNDTT